MKIRLLLKSKLALNNIKLGNFIFECFNFLNKLLKNHQLDPFTIQYNSIAFYKGQF